MHCHTHDTHVCNLVHITSVSFGYCTYHRICVLKYADTMLCTRLHTYNCCLCMYISVGEQPWYNGQCVRLLSRQHGFSSNTGYLVFLQSLPFTGQWKTSEQYSCKKTSQTSHLELVLGKRGRE